MPLAVSHNDEQAGPGKHIMHQGQSWNASHISWLGPEACGRQGAHLNLVQAPTSATQAGRAPTPGTVCDADVKQLTGSVKVAQLRFHGSPHLKRTHLMRHTSHQCMSHQADCLTGPHRGNLVIKEFGTEATGLSADRRQPRAAHSDAAAEARTALHTRGQLTCCTAHKAASPGAHRGSGD